MAGGKTRWWKWYAGIGAVGALVVVVFILPTGESPQVRVLSNGTKVRLGRVEFVRVYRMYSSGNLWQRLVAEYVPEKYARRLGSTAMRMTNSSERLMLMIETSPTNSPGPSQSPPTGINPQFPWAPGMTGPVVELVDDSGDALLMNVTPGYFYGRLGLDLFDAPLVSHYARRLTLRVSYDDQTKRTNYAVKFEVDYPVVRTVPKWKAGALPLTNSVDGDVEAALVNLEPGSGHKINRAGIVGWTEHSSRARLTISQRSDPAARWQPTGVTVTDETGHSYRPFEPTSGPDGWLDFEGSFSPSEARKFVFELQRRPPFKADEPAVTRRVSASEMRDKALVQVIGEVANTQVRATLHAPEAGRNYSTVGLECEITPSLPKSMNVSIFVNGTDEQGREVELLNFYIPDALSSQRVVKRVPKAIWNRDLEFTFALTSGRKVVFLAKPEGGPIKNSK
jgi:hypothetical protein